MIRELTEAAQADEPVLLIGEPNTGKRTYGRLIHERGPRASGPCVVISCAGLVDQESVTKAFGNEHNFVFCGTTWAGMGCELDDPPSDEQSFQDVLADAQAVSYGVYLAGVSSTSTST